MKTIIKLISIIALAFITNSQLPCESKCPVYTIDQGICASNGKIYTDLCRAQCKDPNLKEFFTCEFPFTWETRGECAIECEKRVNTRHSDDSCVNYCPVYFKRNFICASNGRLFNDLCRANCFDDSLTELFSCGDLPECDCQSKCYKTVFALACQEKCDECSKPSQTFCANDGNLYDSLCKARCIGLNIHQNWTCANRGYKKEKDCYIGCRNDLNCSKQCCEEKINYVCGRNGIVYKNECELECGRQKALYIIKRHSPDEIQKCMIYARSVDILNK